MKMFRERVLMRQSTNHSRSCKCFSFTLSCWARAKRFKGFSRLRLYVAFLLFSFLLSLSRSSLLVFCLLKKQLLLLNVSVHFSPLIVTHFPCWRLHCDLLVVRWLELTDREKDKNETVLSQFWFVNFSSLSFERRNGWTVTFKYQQWHGTK